MKFSLSSIVLVILICIFSSNANALNPVKEYKVTPDKFGMKYKEEKVPTSDGATLNAWFFETTKKTTNWMVISGSGDGNMADNLEQINSFLSAGYNVAAYDYRGYGASSEFQIDPEIYIYPQFLTDLSSVLDYLRKSRAITKFNLYGTNIGAGISLGVGANRVETQKIVADGPFLSLETMKNKIKERRQKEVMMPFGFDKNYEPLYAYGKTPAHLKGVLVIVSANDDLITPADTKLLKGITKTYIVKGSPSNDKNFTSDKNKYFEEISNFLNN